MTESPRDLIRSRAVLCDPLAQGREAMAEFLLNRTNQTVSEILTALALAPAGPAPTEADDADGCVNFFDRDRGRES